MTLMKRKNICIWIWLVCCLVLLCHGCAEYNNEKDAGIQNVVGTSTEVLTESDETYDDYMVVIMTWILSNFIKCRKCLFTGISRVL